MSEGQKEVAEGTTYAITEGGIEKLKRVAALRNIDLVVARNTKVLPDGPAPACTCGSKVGHTEDCQSNFRQFIVSCSIRVYLNKNDVMENS